MDAHDETAFLGDGAHGIRTTLCVLVEEMNLFGLNADGQSTRFEGIFELVAEGVGGRREFIHGGYTRGCLAPIA